MSWEYRGSRLHYYTARRVGGRVVKEYVPPAVARLAAAADAEARAARKSSRAATTRTLAQLAEIGAILDPVDQLAGTALRAAYLAAGYHVHKGQWRKRRG